MKNGTNKRGQRDDRFGSGTSQEAAKIERALTDERGDPGSEEIARLAYDRYLARGGEDGRAEEDWLAAEQELRHRS